VRVAAVYDVHGNLPALEAVLAEVDADAAILVGGDVSSGPFPVETLERLRAFGPRVHFVRGNADRVLDFAGANDGEVWVQSRLWVADRLGQERLAFLAGLPLDVTLDIDRLGPVRAQRRQRRRAYEDRRGAYWLELGPDVSFRRTEYDVEAAAAAIGATGYANAARSNGYILDADPGRADRMSALIEGV
jgi:hypothetical protein